MVDELDHVAETKLAGHGWKADAGNADATEEPEPERGWIELALGDRGGNRSEQAGGIPGAVQRACMEKDEWGPVAPR